MTHSAQVMTRFASKTPSPLKSKTNNYFRCGREAFFFDDRSYESIRDAYDAAQLYLEAHGRAFRFVVYRKPQIGGEWDGLYAYEVA